MSAALERVIAEQQERIDRYEAMEKQQTESARKDFERHRALFDNLSTYINEVNRQLFPYKDHKPEFKREYFLNIRDRLRKSAEDLGYCWRCEHYGCVCDMDCGCED